MTDGDVLLALPAVDQLLGRAQTEFHMPSCGIRAALQSSPRGCGGVRGCQEPSDRVVSTCR
jgi:hypothetical protein